jgi:hypothetical protein
MVLMDRKGGLHSFGHLNFGYSILSFDFAQDGESFDSAQDREPVERLVEPFRVSGFVLRICVIKAELPCAPLRGAS